MKIQLPGTSLAPRICTICGKHFLGGPSARFCPECRAEKKKEYSREYKIRKRAGKSIILGVTKGKCVRCGKEFIYHSGMQKYCEDCAEEAMREVDRKTGRGWLNQAAEKYGQQYLDDRNKERRVFDSHDKCQECGAPLPPGHSPNTIYCDNCKRLHAAYQAYKKRTKDAVKYADWKASRFCAVCGKPLENTKSRFCPDCRKLYTRFRQVRRYRRINGRPDISFDDYLKGVKGNGKPTV